MLTQSHGTIGGLTAYVVFGEFAVFEYRQYLQKKPQKPRSIEELVLFASEIQQVEVIASV